MRSLLVVLSMMVMLYPVNSQEKPEDGKSTKAAKIEAPTGARERAEEPSVTLKVGDPAPEFSADKWLKGDEVKKFEEGKVYIVEFWATWCGPCIVMMPHISELQQQFKDKGLTVIGFTKKDGNNSLEKVTDFVQQAEHLKYTFAYADGGEVYAKWMTASGQRGIPCCFVVDQKGKLAYIGHPMFLDGVLPKVMDGSWKAEEGDELVKEYNAKFSEMMKAASGDPEEGLKQFSEIESKYPWFKNIPYGVAPRLMLLGRAKKFDELKTAANELIDKCTAHSDSAMLSQISSVLNSPALKNEEGMGDLSLKAIEAAVKVSKEKDVRILCNLASVYQSRGKKDDAKAALAKAEAAVKDNDYSNLMNLARIFYTMGDAEKGKALGKKAVEAAPERVRPNIERALKQMEESGSKT